MKQNIILGCLLAVVLIASVQLARSCKAHYEQKQEHRQQETQEYIEEATDVCDTAFVYVDLISRARCYERLLG